MKKIFSVLFLSISLFSYSQNENKINFEISEYLKKNTYDPKSYQLVESNVIDTITVHDYAKSKIDSIKKYTLLFQETIEEYNEKILKRRIDLEEVKTMKYVKEVDRKGMIQDLNNSIKRKNENIEMIKRDISEMEKENLELEKFDKNFETVCYVYKHEYRLKHSSGNLELLESYFTFDKNYKILSKSENQSESFKTAGKEFDRIFMNKKNSR